MADEYNERPEQHEQDRKAGRVPFLDPSIKAVIEV